MPTTPARRIAATALSAALLGFPIAALASSADAAPTPKSYKNCTALNSVYKHGVGKKSAVDKINGKVRDDRVKNFTVSTTVYNLNNGPRQGAQYDLDRDNDGVACEKK